MEEHKDQSFQQMLKTFLAPERRVSVGLTVQLCLQSLLMVAMAFVTRAVIDGGLPVNGRIALRWAALLACSVAIPVLYYLSRGYAEKISDQAVCRLRRHMLTALQGKSCAAVNTLHSGVLYDRLMRDCFLVCQKPLSLIPETISQSVRLAGALCALAMLSGRAAAATMGFGGVVLCLMLPFREELKRRRHQVSEAEETLTSCLQEQLEQREVVQGISAGAACAERFGERSGNWRFCRTRLRRFQLAGSALFAVAVQLISAGAILWGVALVYRSSMTFGELTAIIQLLALFRAPVSGLGGLPGRLAAVHAAEERLGQLWELPEEPAAQPIPDGAEIRALVFDHVTFHYGEERRAVLKDFSARVPLRQWTYLSGPSGQGKSTVYRLILGLYPVESGHVFLETDQGNIPCSAATRKVFGYVPQLPVLFSGTIRENLTLNGQKTEKELWNALEACCCDFVHQLPDGLDTALGEGGLCLSVGQRQRLALARAILGNPQVLLLDEATASLDRSTEAQVLRTLSNRFQGALLATHRVEAAREVTCAELILNDGE